MLFGEQETSSLCFIWIKLLLSSTTSFFGIPLLLSSDHFFCYLVSSFMLKQCSGMFTPGERELSFHLWISIVHRVVHASWLLSCDTSSCWLLLSFAVHFYMLLILLHVIISQSIVSYYMSSHAFALKVHLHLHLHLNWELLLHLNCCVFWAVGNTFPVTSESPPPTVPTK